MKKNKKRTATSSPAPSVPVTATAPQAARSDGFRSFILLVTGIIIMFVFFGLEPNKLWLNQRIIPYWEDFKEQKLNLDIEERKMARFQYDYLYSKNIAEFFNKKGIAQNVLVLMPPTEYCRAYGINFHVPEPAVFYYYTGVKTTWANSAVAAKANWFVSVNNGRLSIDSVTDKRVLMDTIAAFKKFNITL